jgi:hypothetical protein
MYRRLWAAGEPVRAELLVALRGRDGETLLELLRRIAGAIGPADTPAAKSASSHTSGGES